MKQSLTHVLYLPLEAVLYFVTYCTTICIEITAAYLEIAKRCCQ